MANKKEDSMSEFFRTGYKEITSNAILMELGKGRGIGNVSGSYKLYAMKIEREGGIESTTAIIGTEIKSADSNELIAVNMSKDNIFSANELPIILVNLRNAVNPISMTVEWIDLNAGEKATPSYYLVPSAHSQGYAWWDAYSVMFNIPELSQRPDGEYGALITIKDESTGNVLYAKDSFTIRTNKSIESSSNNIGSVNDLNENEEV